ncbi:unnamed protein product [Mycena citricolor]|uniref:SWIM-type domain-containing protein n=1 Tax=Mycena citricolor TaxID=2018698 RepID=A0AAD2JX86_9AGAR|nr:unnamed protein product [Mycena citricolor]
MSEVSYKTGDIIPNFSPFHTAQQYLRFLNVAKLAVNNFRGSMQIFNELVVPTFEAKMLKFDPTWRSGRSKELTPWQSAFKAGWHKLLLRTLGSDAGAYTTDLSMWTCSCDQQKYNAFLLCKHLVQGVQPPDPKFFRQVYCRRVSPFYQHELLKPKDSSRIDQTKLVPSEMAGDFDAEAIAGSNGRASPNPARGAKRSRSGAAVNAPAGSGDATEDPIPVSSSPPRAQPAVRPDEEYNDLDELEEYGRKLVEDLHRAAEIVNGQLGNIQESQILLRSVKRRKIGNDVTSFVADFRHANETGQLRSCCEKDAKAAREKRTKQRPNGSEPDHARDEGHDEDASDFIDAEAMPLAVFLDVLSKNKDTHHLIGLVDISSLLNDPELPQSESDELDCKPVVDRIASLIWERTEYRFLYLNSRSIKHTNTTRFLYSCAQIVSRQHKPKKSADPAKRRDKGQMDTFECEGYLTIWAGNGETQYFVRYAHQDLHVTYKCIDLPEDIKSLVRDRARTVRVPEIWKEILTKHPQPLFSQEQVYNLWLKYHRISWHRDDDEEKSARLLIEEFRRNNPRFGAHIESIPLPKNEDTCTAIAFALPTLIRKWGGGISEIALDSTWKTNKAGYECFALLGEVFGSGLPLAILLIKSKNPEPGAKEKYLRSLIRNITETWKIKPIQSLSDKDITEINAFLAELPADTKHQLCFWHGIRVVRGRLSVLARRPAVYHADEASEEFPFIDSRFLPIAQMDPSECTKAGYFKKIDAVIPTLQIRLDKQLLSRAPARPKVVIQADGHVRDVLQSLESPEDILDVMDDEDEFIDDLGEDLSAVDRLEAAESWLEPGEDANASVFATTSTYVFCPAAHRRQILHMFIRHGCLHPLLPDRNGNLRDKDDIRHDCVFEAYQFCKQRGLREVWAYLWEAWYCPTKWKLWARSSQPNFIGRWRTTMAVENFWRNLKHRTLHNFLHPRLDQLIYLIVTDVVPRFEASMLKFDPMWRLGRSKELTPWQSAFKADWKKLSTRSLGNNAAQTHVTDLSSWTCSCGQQKYNAFLLCKHLVQAVQPPDGKFFREVYRRRVIPFYWHPSLRAMDGSPIDDAKFSPSKLAGDVVDDPELRSNSGTVTRKSKRGVKRLRSPSQPADAGTVSVGQTIDSMGDDFDDLIARSSSPQPSEASVRPDEEFDDSDDLEEYAQNLISDLKKGVDILENQMRNIGESKLLLRSLKRRKVGQDIANFVADFRHSSETGRVRRTTWGLNGGSKARRYSSNTMGSSEG